VSNKPRDNAVGIAAAIVACALLFGWYEFFDRRRSQRMNARLVAYVRQLEQVRPACWLAPPLALMTAPPPHGAAVPRVRAQMKRELQEGCAREAQAQARVLAEETSSRQKDQFVAMVSHEIRTPLNAVGGATALLADTPLNSEQRELVALLEAGTAHVVLIIEVRAAARARRRGVRVRYPLLTPLLPLQDILMHGALVSGAFSVAQERVELVRVVLDPAWRMATMQQSQRAKLATLHLTRAVAPDVPAVIVGDATRLTQVLTNVLSNAIKFTREGE
jgi:signal transduction histidine kinase